jgi:hypothetical protein
MPYDETRIKTGVKAGPQYCGYSVDVLAREAGSSTQFGINTADSCERDAPERDISALQQAGTHEGTPWKQVRRLAFFDGNPCMLRVVEQNAPPDRANFRTIGKRGNQSVDIIGRGIAIIIGKGNDSAA